MPGIIWLPLYLRLILLSIPWGFLQEAYTSQSEKGGTSYTYTDSVVLVRSEAVGVLSNLLDDLSLVQGLDCHFNYI